MYDIYIFIHNIYEPHQVLKIECIIFMVFKLYSGYSLCQEASKRLLTCVINHQITKYVVSSKHT